MITIDVHPTVKLQATVGTWKGVAESLGVSTQTLFGYRKALDLMGQPITPELLEELRRLSRWCALRNKGGGRLYTRARYVALKSSGALDLALKNLQII